MNQRKLSSAERQFLKNAVAVIYANPFSADRGITDRKLIDFPTGEDYTTRYQRIMAAVAEGVDRLVVDGNNNFQHFEGKDRRLVKNVLAFHVYHQIFLRFDPLIEQQINSGNKPLKFHLADDAIRMLVGYGFTENEAAGYFAAYFQFRRAYYFIKQTIIGSSPCIIKLRESLWNNVVTSDIGLYVDELIGQMEDFSTLLLGETGCGKGACASAIGRSAYIPFDKDSKRFVESFTDTFVSLNLSRFPEQIIESELFGHRKGAFTGAAMDYGGALSGCSRFGAVFLDEIGEVSVPVQVKLLQVLEDREFTPVGSYEKKDFHGRIIAATNQPLEKLRSEGRFRDDFYYRLCSDVIHVPPLRQRLQEDPQEMGELIEHVVNRIIGRYSAEVSERVTNAIHEQIPADYRWPGNVRELEQCIRRLLLTQRYEITSTSPHEDNLEERITHNIRTGDINAQQLLSAYCKLLYSRQGSYEAVARITDLDRRTVKKYVTQ